jgi:hypothetical protein
MIAITAEPMIRSQRCHGGWTRATGMPGSAIRSAPL